MVYDCVAHPEQNSSQQKVMHRRVPKKPFCCSYIPSLTNLFVFCAFGANGPKRQVNIFHSNRTLL